MKTTYYKETIRLKAVSEKPGKNGRFGVEPFDDETLDAEFDLNDLDRMLGAVAEKVYRTQRFYRIDHRTDFDERGNLVIETGDGNVIFDDIRNRIDGIGDDPGFFCVFDAELQKIRWIVSILVELEIRDCR